MTADTIDSALPPGPLLAYYGDDFTGSTDAMEVMASAGVATVLFIGTPTPELLARFPDVRCVGMAGSSRSRSPAWMREALPRAFATLAALGAPIVQYKVCSTFDSSPRIGSIGAAVDIGVARMPGRWSPMVIGAPRLKRYQVFGNLFAAVDGVGYRLDRHPTMARHPVTPMDEADLRVHLARQTKRRIELIDMVQLRAGLAAGRVEAMVANEAANEAPIVLIDVLDEETLALAGRLIWEARRDGLFTASSSGLEYALTAYWRAQRWLPEQTGLPGAMPVPLIAGVSGSCSPVTATQIRAARAAGFHCERLDVGRALVAHTRDAEIARAARAALDALRRGQSAIVFSAQGPDDPSVLAFAQLAHDAGLARGAAASAIGATLAAVMRRILDCIDVPRIVIAGGDSSGEVAGALGIDALSVAAAMAPGAPLCRAWSRDARRDGLEIVLKGGQIGDADFFIAVRDGASNQDR